MAKNQEIRRITTHQLQEMKNRGEKIAMLTAYDFSMARIIDRAGIDVILVGDSASNVMAGNETTLPITLDQMIYHATSVVRAVKRALVVADMPFGSYETGAEEALHTAARVEAQAPGAAGGAASQSLTRQTPAPLPCRPGRSTPPHPAGCAAAGGAARAPPPAAAASPPPASRHQGWPPRERPG